jgi:3-oxoacyl-[acyl-carrier protein] reductase
VTKTILITGASNGIGAECATWFAQQGWQLCLHGRSEEKLLALSHELTEKYQTKSLYYCGDLTDSATIKPIFQKINQTFSRLDSMVHCAGTMHQGNLAMLKEQDIDQQFALHLKSALLLTQLASRLMIRNKQGSLVFVSSVVAQQGAIGQALYSAAKSGLHGMVKSLAKELGVHNIRVNAVAPGFIETNLVSDYCAEQREQIRQATSLKRLGSTVDVANAIGFLANEQSSYITGQILNVDAGLTLP